MTALHGLVSRLRRALDLGDGSSLPLVSRPPGYLLEVAPSWHDLWECEGLVEEAGRALSGGDAERAASSFARALWLWRGPPLGGATAGTLLADVGGPRSDILGNNFCLQLGSDLVEAAAGTPRVKRTVPRWTTRPRAETQ
jgi:hypothetical protein